MADDLPPRGSADRRLLAWLTAGAIALALAVRLAVALASGFQVDDAWITYRYADHIAQGEGFVYNPGEPVYGTTTPLLTLLLALPAHLGISLPAASVAVGLAATAATMILLALLAAPRAGPREDRPGPAGTALLLGLLAFAPGHVLWAVSGMETALYVAFLAAAVVAFDRGRWGWLGVAAGLAFLTRFDAVVLLVALALVLLLRLLVRPAGADRSSPGDRQILPARGTKTPPAVGPALAPSLGRAAGGFLLVTGPWLAFATLYFGDPVPNSVWAKLALQRQLDLELAVEILREGLAPGLLPFPVEAALTVAGLTALLVRNRLLLIPVWYGGLLAFFFVGRVHLHPWYAIPLHPFALVAWVVGLGPPLVAVARRLVPAQWGVAAPLGRRPLVVIAVLAALLTALPAVPAALFEARGRQEAHEHSHAGLGRFLAAESRPGETIYAWDIGYIGYLSGRRILDAIGIVSPEVIPYNRRGEHAEVLLDFRPEWAVVALWPPAGAAIVSDPRVRALYRRLERRELVLRRSGGAVEPVGGDYAVLRRR